MTDPRVDMVSFTGSTATGRRIMSLAARSIKTAPVVVAVANTGELIEHGKSEGLDAIEAVVMTTNRAMIHVAEQCGFESILDKDEGVVRQYLDLRNPQAALPLADVAMRRVTAPICI